MPSTWTRCWNSWACELLRVALRRANRLGLAHEVAILKFSSGAMLAAQKAGHGGRAGIGCGFKWRSRDLGFVPKAVIQNLGSANRLAHFAILPAVGDFWKNESNTLADASQFLANSGPDSLGTLALAR